MAPTWATTGTRPAVWSITISVTRRRSPAVIAANSPVDPHGTRPWIPSVMWSCTRRRRPASSTASDPASNGVMSAASRPEMSAMESPFSRLSTIYLMR